MDKEQTVMRVNHVGASNEQPENVKYKGVIL